MKIGSASPSTPAGLLLLPGMDGSGELWTPLLAALGNPDAQCVRYARDTGDYDALLARIELPRAPTTVLAESFGGPLAIRLASRSSHVRALVLVASFSMAPRRARWLAPLSGLGPHVPPRFVLRAALLGGERHHAIEDALVRAIGDVTPDAMRTRIREVARVDVRAELARLTIPVTWIHARRDRLLGAPPPGATHVIDGPHLLAQTRPAEVAAIVRAAIGA
jgi:sigma-B regulation protein RsbQ